MKSSVTVLSLVMVLALVGIVNAAGTPGDSGEDGSSSPDDRSDLCKLRPGQERFSEAFKASVKKTCYD
ncbi:hypothetical protein K457DRAFT_25809 [Linnemannia elongata AG-77]|uniref:Uncharacterized protein n=1 Tax=Linnemannia elongata AG-77 TaxID=1314771 RepID=A0A197JCH1_9FUNG|nr:hypothetical protein K457DRAFT_25809 [Linnemannia elongata AG-77]